MNKDWPLNSLVDTTIGRFDSSLGPLVAEWFMLSGTNAFNKRMGPTLTRGTLVFL